jgi:8-oxo-dGTP pyrophosphatase MutT (NUDIX family)
MRTHACIFTATLFLLSFPQYRVSKRIISYNPVDPRMNYAGAGFILLSSDLTHLLLVHDTRSGKWGFPKGHRESYDASDLATAIRECREETGLLHPIDYTVHDDPFKISKGGSSYLFRYAVLNGAATKDRLRAGPAHEIAGLEWISIATLLEAQNVLDGNKYLRAWISDVKANASKKAVYLLKSLFASKGLTAPAAAATTPSSSPRFGPCHESASPCNIVTCA